MWNDVQNNIGKFQDLFGSNFIIIDNSKENEGIGIKAATTKAFVSLRKWLNKPIQNKTAKTWIAAMGGRIGAK
jgi:hypothetical protein